MIKRRKTRPVWVGPAQVGGGAPVSVQSMTNTDTRDVEATVAQINRLAGAGCEIVRTAVPDQEAARALSLIKAQIGIPLIADIHFDYNLALSALESGVDGLRINPGNIGGEEKTAIVVEAAKKRKAPVRIGVNAGSLEKDPENKYSRVCAMALVESALRQVRLFEKLDYYELKISVKSSDVPLMLEAYRLLSEKIDYPLHLGVTEAGTLRSGIVKSAVGIGALLAEGIGDTIRVSLTGDPAEEVRAGYEILKTLGLRKRGVELISCPTCGRTQIDLIKIANDVEEKLKDIVVPVKVAVMGCVVNGPGEARQADIGIAGGKGGGVLFRHGEIVRRLSEDEMVEELVREVKSVAGRRTPVIGKNF